jgi:hypothetical protein
MMPAAHPDSTGVSVSFEKLIKQTSLSTHDEAIYNQDVAVGDNLNYKTTNYSNFYCTPVTVRETNEQSHTFQIVKLEQRTFLRHEKNF